MTESEPDKGHSTSDVVVDTNVWVHSANPGVDKHASALDFVLALKDSTTHLCFDTGASTVEAENTSRILSEYTEHVKGAGLGRQILSLLLQTQRFSIVDPSVSNNVRNVINQNVPDPSDRIFAKVAANSASKRLVSHDEAAFHTSCKKALKKTCGIVVVSAAEDLAA